MNLTSTDIEGQYFFESFVPFAVVPEAIPQKIRYVEAVVEAQKIYDLAVKDAEEKLKKSKEEAQALVDNAQATLDAAIDEAAIKEAQDALDKAKAHKEEVDKVSEVTYNQTIEEAKKEKEKREKCKNVFMVYGSNKFWGGFAGHYDTAQVLGAYKASLLGVLERLILGCYAWNDGGLHYANDYENDVLTDAFPTTYINRYNGRNLLEDWWSGTWLQVYTGIKSMAEAFRHILNYEWKQRPFKQVTYLPEYKGKITEDLGGYILPLTVRRGKWKNSSQWENKTPSANELIPSISFEDFQDEETLMDKIGETLQYLLFLGEHSTENASEIGNDGSTQIINPDWTEGSEVDKYIYYDDQGYLFRWIKNLLNLTSKWKEDFLCCKEPKEDVLKRVDTQITAANNVYTATVAKAKDKLNATIEDAKLVKEKEEIIENARHEKKLEEIAASEYATPEEASIAREEEDETHTIKLEAIKVKYDASVDKANTVYALAETEANKIKQLDIENSESEKKKVENSDWLKMNVWFEDLPSRFSKYQSEYANYNACWTKPEAVYFLRSCFDNDTKLTGVLQTALDSDGVELFRRMLHAIYTPLVQLGDNKWKNYRCGIASSLSLDYSGQQASGMRLNVFPWAYVTAAMGRLAPIGCVIYLNTSTKYELQKIRDTSLRKLIRSPRLKYYHQRLNAGKIVRLRFYKNPKYDDDPIEENLITYSLDYPEDPEVEWTVEDEPRENTIDYGVDCSGKAVLDGGRGCTLIISFSPWKFMAQLQDIYDKDGVDGILAKVYGAKTSNVPLPQEVYNKHLEKVAKEKEALITQANNERKSELDKLDEAFDEDYDSKFKETNEHIQDVQTAYDMEYSQLLNERYEKPKAEYEATIQKQQELIDEANAILANDSTNEAALKQLSEAQSNLQTAQSQLQNLESQYDDINAQIEEELKEYKEEINRSWESFHAWEEEASKQYANDVAAINDKYDALIKKYEEKEEKIKTHKGTVIEANGDSFFSAIHNGESPRILSVSTYLKGLDDSSYSLSLDDSTYTFIVGTEAVLPNDTTTGETISLDLSGFNLFPNNDLPDDYKENETLHSLWNASATVEGISTGGRSIVKSMYKSGKEDENSNIIKNQHITIANDDFRNKFLATCLSTNGGKKQHLRTKQDITAFAKNAFTSIPKKTEIEGVCESWIEKYKNSLTCVTTIYMCFLEGIEDNGKSIWIGHNGFSSDDNYYYDEENNIIWTDNGNVSIAWILTPPDITDVWKLNNWVDAATYSASAKLAGFIGAWDWKWKSLIYNDN